jgi:hypothetical protein
MSVVEEVEDMLQKLIVAYTKVQNFSLEGLTTMTKKRLAYIRAEKLLIKF